MNLSEIQKEIDQSIQIEINLVSSGENILKSSETKTFSIESRSSLALFARTQTHTHTCKIVFPRGHGDFRPNVCRFSREFRFTRESSSTMGMEEKLVGGRSTFSQFPVQSRRFYRLRDRRRSRNSRISVSPSPLKRTKLFETRKLLETIVSTSGNVTAKNLLPISKSSPHHCSFPFSRSKNFIRNRNEKFKILVFLWLISTSTTIRISGFDRIATTRKMNKLPKIPRRRDRSLRNVYTSSLRLRRGSFSEQRVNCDA